MYLVYNLHHSYKCIYRQRTSERAFRIFFSQEHEFQTKKYTKASKKVRIFGSFFINNVDKVSE